MLIFIFNFRLFILLANNPCMCKYKLVEFHLDPKIERNVRRFRKGHKNSKVVVAMNDLQDMGNLNP